MVFILIEIIKKEKKSSNSFYYPLFYKHESINKQMNERRISYNDRGLF